MADGEQEHNPLTLSDDEIYDQIFETHSDADSECDVDFLFNLVQNILKPSSHLADNVLQGSRGNPENVDEKSLQASVIPPLRALKQIFSEISCKPPTLEIAYKTTLTILGELSNYSWPTKAVLTLTAFALNYGNFSMFSQYQQEYQQNIIGLNYLIKTSLQVTETIFELEKLRSFHTEDGAFALALDYISVDVYWTITTIVACVTQINCVTSESEEKLDLSHIGPKITIRLSKLKKQVFKCKQKTEPSEISAEAHFPRPSFIPKPGVQRESLNKEGNYIFNYGGKDKKWLRQFTKHAVALQQHPALKEANISIELLCIKRHKNFLSHFRTRIKRLFTAKMPNTTNTVIQEFHKMLSSKNEIGWALLSKGPTMVPASPILKTVAEFEKWKEDVIKKGFEISFKEQHENVVENTRRWSHLEIPYVNGRIPESILCPECHQIMEVYVTYKCCRTENAIAPNEDKNVVKTTPLCWHLETRHLARKSSPEEVPCLECHQTMEVFITYKCCHTENATTPNVAH